MNSQADYVNRQDNVIVLDPKFQQMRSFKPDSMLHYYLSIRKNSLIAGSVTLHRLSTILVALKEIIEEEELFDSTNKEIIVLNSELRLSFSLNQLHVSQLIPRLESLLIREEPKRVIITLSMAEKEISAMNFWRNALLRKTTLLGTRFNSKIQYKVKVGLFRLFRKSSETFIRNRVMTYHKACQLMTNYVNSSDTILVDPENPTIFDLRRDRLKRVFGKNYVTCDQLLVCVKEHLKPYCVRKRQPKIKIIP